MLSANCRLSIRSYIFREYFDDPINAEAEIKLPSEYPYIEWRTTAKAKKAPRAYYVLLMIGAGLPVICLQHRYKKTEVQNSWEPTQGADYFRGKLLSCSSQALP